MWSASDVGTVLESLPRGVLTVSAGAGGMTRKISRARLAATAGDLDRPVADELIVTSVTDLAAAGTPARVLARLDAAQVGALAVQLDASGLLADDVLAAADRFSLPVITFADGTASADVVAAVLDALLSAQRQRLQRVLDIHQAFTRIVLAGGGTAEVAETLHLLLECPVAVLDAAGGTIVAVPADASEGRDLAVGPVVRQAITAGRQQYGEIVAFTDGVLLDDDRLLALERAATAIAVRSAQASAVAEAQERFAAISLEELIAGHAGDAVDVAERAISFGWDLRRPRAVLLASIDPPTDGKLGALATIAAAARATLGRDAIIWTRSTTIAALVAPETDAPDERRRIAERLRHELDQRLRVVTVSIGVGRRVDDPALLRRSFLEASRSVDVGRWAKGRHVTEVFDELGLERLLASTPTDHLAEFVQHSIGPLVEHDRTHHTELVETLGAWLETRNMAEAARRMHVHYNTFKNRLERIETILGPLATNAGRALECAVAIYIARHYDGPWAAGSVT